MGGVMDHSRQVSDTVDLGIPEYEYTQAGVACHITSHLHMTLNELKNVEC
jgi:hypothetical protein